MVYSQTTSGITDGGLTHMLEQQYASLIPTYQKFTCTGVFKITEGRFPAFQRFSNSKLVLKSVESRFPALNYFENASTSISSQ